MSNEEEGRDLPEKREENQHIPEEFQHLPPDIQRFMSASYVGPMPNPLYDKLTPEHITAIINAGVKEDERRFKYFSSERNYKVFYFLSGLVVLALLTFFLLPYDKEMYTKIVEWTLVFASGSGVGRAFKKGSKD